MQTFITLVWCPARVQSFRAQAGTGDGQQGRAGAGRPQATRQWRRSWPDLCSRRHMPAILNGSCVPALRMKTRGPRIARFEELQLHADAVGPLLEWLSELELDLAEVLDHMI